MTPEEIERADEAACKLDGMFRDIFNQKDRQDILMVVISTVDTYRAEEKRKHCKHYNRIGNGSAGSDGSSSYTWHCPTCGASESYSTPAQRSPEESAE